MYDCHKPIYFILQTMWSSVDMHPLDLKTLIVDL